jgi:hypothetical protein
MAKFSLVSVAGSAALMFLVLFTAIYAGRDIYCDRNGNCETSTAFKTLKKGVFGEDKSAQTAPFGYTEASNLGANLGAGLSGQNLNSLTNYLTTNLLPWVNDQLASDPIQGVAVKSGTDSYTIGAQGVVLKSAALGIAFKKNANGGVALTVSAKKLTVDIGTITGLPCTLSGLTPTVGPINQNSFDIEDFAVSLDVKLGSDGHSLDMALPVQTLPPKNSAGRFVPGSDSWLCFFGCSGLYEKGSGGYYCNDDATPIPTAGKPYCKAAVLPEKLTLGKPIGFTLNGDNKCSSTVMNGLSGLKFK